MYTNRQAIDAITKSEAQTGILEQGGGTTKFTADDLGRLQEFRYFNAKMREIRSALDSNPKPKEAIKLRERLHLLEVEYRKTWRECGLSTDPQMLKKQIEPFKGLLDKKTMAALAEARFASEHGWESRQGLRMIDMQIMLAELQKANPNLVKGATIFDMGDYYQQKIAARAERIFSEELAKHGDPDLALARAVESVRAMIGGTSIASWRGRAFEGLSADELNGNDKFLAEYGYLYTFKRNNYPTYDGVSVKGVSSKKLTIVDSPKIIKSKTGGKDKIIRQLQIFDGSRRVYHWLDGRPPKVTTAQGYTVFLWSAKARRGYKLYDMYKATGSARTPHDTGRLLTTPEFANKLQRSIDWTRTRIDNLMADPSTPPKELRKMQTRLQDLLHFQKNLSESAGWSNARIDAMLENMRNASIDIEAIESGLYEQYSTAAGGNNP
jgi:hypothetical protein